MRKPRMANVPELRRLSVAEATTRLSALNLKLKVVQRRASEDIPADQIMETSPAANEKVYENSEVTAVVSAGSRFVEIPDIRGLNMDKAKMLLGSVGLELDPVADKQRVSDATPGMIVSSEPEWGKRVERGTRVRVTVAAERSEKNSSKLGEKFLYSVKIICKGIQAPVVVRVEITDEQGTRTVHEESHDPDEEFTVETEGFGKKATFSIYYDNELVKQFEQNAEEEPTP
ncbi:MAG: PASTA domain-containing protein [Fimbriimonadales bacterium]